MLLLEQIRKSRAVVKTFFRDANKIFKKKYPGIGEHGGIKQSQNTLYNPTSLNGLENDIQLLDEKITLSLVVSNEMGHAEAVVAVASYNELVSVSQLQQNGISSKQPKHLV